MAKSHSAIVIQIDVLFHLILLSIFVINICTSESLNYRDLYRKFSFLGCPFECYTGPLVLDEAQQE